MRCPHCNSPCRYIGEQRGAEKYYGKRMFLWTCLGCGTTLSQMEEGNTPVAHPKKTPVSGPEIFKTNKRK